MKLRYGMSFIWKLSWQNIEISLQQKCCVLSEQQMAKKKIFCDEDVMNYYQVCFCFIIFKILNFGFGKICLCFCVLILCSLMKTTNLATSQQDLRPRPADVTKPTQAPFNTKDKASMLLFQVKEWHFFQHMGYTFFFWYRPTDFRSRGKNDMSWPKNFVFESFDSDMIKLQIFSILAATRIHSHFTKILHMCKIECFIIPE